MWLAYSILYCQGEKLEVVDDEAEQFWWQARNKRGQVGFIPYNYVAEIKTSEVELHPYVAILYLFIGISYTSAHCHVISIYRYVDLSPYVVSIYRYILYVCA